MIYLSHSAGAGVACWASCRKLVDTPISAALALYKHQTLLCL